MSADNGIYILLNQNENGKSEYRVAYAQAIENIFDDTYSDQYLKQYFGKCKVFNEQADALKFAYDLYEKVIKDLGRNMDDIGGGVYIEYGICPIHEYKNKPFPKD